MSKLWRKLQRIGKRAVRYNVEVTYRELELTCVERWQPNKLIICWSHHSRHEHTHTHSLEPSIAQPSLGYVRWPPTGERSNFDVTLFYDPFAQTYDEKWWQLSVDEFTRNGERRLLARSRVSVIDLASASTSSDGAGHEEQLHSKTFDLRSYSSKVRSAKLTVHIRVTAAPETIDEQIPLVSAVAKTQSDAQRGVESALQRSGLRRFSTRVRETFRRRRNAPTNRSERRPPRSISGTEIRTQVNFPKVTEKEPSAEAPKQVIETVSTALPQHESNVLPIEASIPVDKPSADPPLSQSSSQICVPDPSKKETEHIKTPPIIDKSPKVLAVAAAPSLNVTNESNGGLPQADPSSSSPSALTTSASVIGGFEPKILTTPTTSPTPVANEPDDLLNWCKKATADCRTVRITNLTTSFRNGLAFCAIIQHYRPSFIDVAKMSAADMVENNRRAFELASRYFGIAPLIEPSAIVGSFIPDKQSVITYVSSLRSYFAEHPLATDHELEQFKIDALKIEASADNGVEDDVEDEVVELRCVTSNDPVKRTSSNSSGAKKVFGALKKRSSSGFQKLLGRSSTIERDDSEEKDKHGSARSSAEREERSKTNEEHSDSPSSPTSAEAPAVPVSPSIESQSPATGAVASVSLRNSRVFATSPGESSPVGVALRFQQGSTVDAEVENCSPGQRMSHPHSHRSSKLFKRHSKHHDDADAEQQKSATKPSAIVVPATRNSMVISDKRELMNAKVNDLLVNGLPKTAPSSELTQELTKFESEMNEVDARLAVIEAHLREATQRKARTIGSVGQGQAQAQAGQQVQAPSAASVASSKLGNFGRTFSLRKSPAQTPAASATAAQKAITDAEREEQILISQRIALTNHKNTLVHKLNRLNLLLQDEELEKLNQAFKDQLQEFSKLPDWEKADDQRKIEERLTTELLEVVRKRNQIVMDIDENEQELEKAIELEEKMRNVALDSGAKAEQCVIS